MHNELENLIDEILHDPVNFKKNHSVDDLISRGIDFGHLREMVRKIYDLNESQLSNMSNANNGLLGYLNRRSSRKREKVRCNKIDRKKSGAKYYTIYAEGDSWFQFPAFLKDVIDWLNDHDDIIIKSDAYGGDWITNILYEGQYIPALTTVAPDFFLISGGGNDLVGDHRLSNMVSEKISPDVPRKYSSADEITSPLLNDEEKGLILKAQEHLNKEFYAILAVFELQYSLVFKNLYSAHSKHRDIISITQGYDYAVPENELRFSLRTPGQPLLNYFLDSGNWLFTPLMARGIIDREAQRAIMFTMIFEFNEMLSSFALKHENVYHVDSRGLARGQEDWFDELHYKSHVYRYVAQAYEYIIRNKDERTINKIVRSADFRK